MQRCSYLAFSFTMGNLFARLLGGLFGGSEVRILILGLDNAGKTTILCMFLVLIFFEWTLYANQGLPTRTTNFAFA